ncbi:MAG: hypothetical protein AAFX79_03990 [Planctomycetota bacterium]
MAAGTRFSVGRPSGTCAATGASLAPGARVASAIVADDADAWRRLDVAEAAWVSGWRPDGSVVATWRGTMPEASDDAPARIIDDEELVALFDQIGDAEERSAIELRYVVALMLIRRRRLRVEGHAPEGLRVRRLTPTGGFADDGSTRIADPGFDDDQLEAAIERVTAVLLGGDAAEPDGEATEDGPA